MKRMLLLFVLLVAAIPATAATSPGWGTAVFQSAPEAAAAFSAWSNPAAPADVSLIATGDPLWKYLIVIRINGFCWGSSPAPYDAVVTSGSEALRLITETPALRKGIVTLPTGEVIGWYTAGTPRNSDPAAHYCF